MSKPTSQMLREVRAIQREHGWGYFILPGRRSSRRVTGGRDYWRFAYNVLIGDATFDGGITSQRRLAESYREAVAEGGGVVRVEVVAEHVSQECDSHLSRSPDVHSHEDKLGEV